MIEREDVVAMVRSCLEEVNREREPNERFVISEGVRLLSEDSPLDSVEFIAFVSHLESELQRLAGRDVELVASALAEQVDPFETVQTLADYIKAVVDRP